MAHFSNISEGMHAACLRFRELIDNSSTYLKFHLLNPLSCPPPALPPVVPKLAQMDGDSSNDKAMGHLNLQQIAMQLPAVTRYMRITSTLHVQLHQTLHACTGLIYTTVLLLSVL